MTVIKATDFQIIGRSPIGGHKGYGVPRNRPQKNHKKMVVILLSVHEIIHWYNHLLKSANG